MRQRVLEALIATSGQPDALRCLGVRPSLAKDVARNSRLPELPTRRAVDTYAGPLYEGLGAESWSAAARTRASRELLIVSALWGALRPDDCIPAYRLHVCARLSGLDRLEPMWRSVLPPVLDEAAERRGPILDLRSPVYQATGRPHGLDDETVTLRVRRDDDAHVGDVIAKRVRGEAAHHLLASTSVPDEPLDVADLLAEHWPIELEAPNRRNRGWTISLVVGQTSAPLLARNCLPRVDRTRGRYRT